VPVAEAEFRTTKYGPVPDGDGWFVLNARDTRWREFGPLGRECDFQGKRPFKQIGVNVNVLEPGELMAIYHSENKQEGFLVLTSECDLGAYDDPSQKHPRIVRLAKHRLSLEDIVLQFERNTVHPLTVPVIEEHEGTYVVHLAGVYWALHRMLKAALTDRTDEIERAVAALDLPEISEVDD
jgi:hypothetical protein